MIVAHEDSLERVRQFERPVWLLKGTGSASALHQIIDELAAALPDARVSEMPAGHGPHLVSTERFLSGLAEFQAGVPRTAGV